MLSKVAEKLIFKPLYKYLEVNKLIPSSQYAYRKHLGTCDALLDLTNFVQENLDKRYESRIVQIDFSAAFDLVNHSALIFKLRNVGVGGYILDILIDFLDNRHQRVVVDGAFSGVRPVISGVPQGSVLGPLLFLLYTSDLSNELENKLVQYADDSTLVITIPSPDVREAAAQSLSRDLERISCWCEQWGMKLNSKKTKTLIVSRSRTLYPAHPPVSIGDTVLENNEHLTILGVTFDSKLTFSEHLMNVSSNASRKLGIVRKASFIYGDNQVNLTCFRSFVLPLLEYCSPVWRSAADRSLNLLDKIARSGNFLFPQNGNYDLDHRRNISCLSLFHKFYFNKEIPLSNLVPESYVAARVTRFAEQRHQFSVRELRCNTVQYQNSYLPYTVKMWNNLESNVFSEDREAFKKLCNRLLS